MRKTTLYAPYTTYFVLLVLAFLYVLVAGLSIFFIKHFIVDGYGDVGSTLLLLAIFWAPLTYVTVGTIKTHGLNGFFTRCKIDAEGIHCRNPFQAPYTIDWQAIHVYGIYYSSYSYRTSALLFLSTDKQELFDKKTVAINSPTRVVFESRDALWLEFAHYMPNQMKHRLQEALDNHKNCFYKM